MPDSLPDLMAAWLAEDMFDEIPEGLPDLDSEDDDETDEGSALGSLGGGKSPDEEMAIISSGGWCSPVGSDALYAPAGFDTDTSVGFFLLPENDEDLPGPEQPKHMTVLYLGHIGGDGAPNLGDYKTLLANVGSIAAKETPAFDAPVVAVEDLGDKGAKVWTVDAPAAETLRSSLMEIDSEVNSLYEDGTFEKYPEYLTHVTIGYATDITEKSGLTNEDVDAALNVQSIHFDRLALWFGEETFEWELGSDQYVVKPAMIPLVSASRGAGL